jgi:hypothetical protein
MNHFGIETLRRAIVLLGIATLSFAASAEEAPAPQTKQLSGMSVLGNSEAPKSLVIVPWKSSEIGDGIGVANMLDNRARPVDRDVFMRELDYYELRTHAEPRPVETAPAAAVAQQ